MKNISLKLTLLLLPIFTYLAHSQHISTNLVGTNVWYNPNQQVWNLTADCGVKMIRIGGHQYDDNMPSNATLLNWVKQIQAMGAEPIIQVSQYQSATAAANIVRYLNITMKDQIAPVKYWNIGNEPWLQYNNLAPNTDVGTLVETYFKPISVAMKEVDPGIKIYGPDFCYYVEFAIHDLFGGKNDIAGKIPGRDYYYCDGISWHKYPQGVSNGARLPFEGMDDFKGSIVKCKAKVESINSTYNRSGADALQWGIGEYNAKSGDIVHSFGNGQMFGGVLGLCMQYEAKYATTWSMFENGGIREGTDFGMIDGANMTPRSSYRHMEFVAKYFKGQYVTGKSSNSGFVVYGSQNGDETSVMIIHRAAGNPKEYTLTLNNVYGAGTYKLSVNGGVNKTYTDITQPNATQVLIFKGDSITKINYTSEHFDNELAPEYSQFVLAGESPLTPANFGASPLSYKKIRLNWTDNANNEQGYIIEREESSGFKIRATVPANSVEYIDLDVTPNTAYSYQIRSYNSAGKSDYTEIATATTPDTPAPKAFNGPHTIPGIIEAEDFNDNEAGIGYVDLEEENRGGQYRNTGVDIENCTEGGFNVGYVNDGEWLAYFIENVTPGMYDIDLRTASNTTSTKRIDVYLGDKNVGSFTPINTAGWQNWTTLTLENIEISSSDPVLMTLKFAGIEYNLNWLKFKKKTASSVEDQIDLYRLKAYYNKGEEMIRIVGDNSTDEYLLNIVNISGQSLYKTNFINPKSLKINTSSWNRGIYMVVITDKNKQKITKLTIN